MENENKKVIFLMPTLSTGGGERIVSELSLNLPEDIQRIIVVFTGIRDKTSYNYNGKIVSLNLPISSNFAVKIYSFFLGIYKFKKIIKEEKPDHIISFGGQLSVINILSNKKALVTFESFIPTTYSFSERIFGILIRFLFNRADKIIVCSKEIGNSLVRNFGVKKEKIKVLYNPIDINKINNLVTEPLEPEYQEIFKNPVIINIGRFAEMKGQWHLVGTFKEVKNKIKDAKLVILGRGELEQGLRKLIKNLDLENDVYLLGWQKNPFKFLANSKLFVLSSPGGEGLPYVILEAMACRLPIISTDCKSGPREILAPNTDPNYQTRDIEYAQYGILTPVCTGKFYEDDHPLNREEKILTDAMVEVLSNKELLKNLAEKSKQRAEEFDAKNIIKEWNFINK